MPFVSYFASRAKNLEITVSDALELIASSTATHTDPGGGAPLVPLAHPPHSQAHVSKEGFTTAFVPLTAKEKITLKALTGIGVRNKVQQQQFETLSARAAGVSDFQKEGMHLDPATKGAYSDPLNVLKDDYSKREFHSQFQDAEIATLALYHALNTKAGQDVMAHLALKPSHRATLTSTTAANALNQGPLKVKNPTRSLWQMLTGTPAPALSAHPDRNKAAQVVLRGKGGAGAAAPAQKTIKKQVVVYPATAPIMAVVSVLDNQNGELVLTTHYPVDLLKKAPQDYTELVDTPVKKNQKLNKQNNFPATIFASAPPVEWSTKRPTILSCAVNSSGLACTICGSVHGATPSLFNKWFQCAKCGAPYCPNHSNGLPAAVVKKGERPGKQCQASNCHGVARWTY